MLEQFVTLDGIWRSGHCVPSRVFAMDWSKKNSGTKGGHLQSFLGKTLAKLPILFRKMGSWAAQSELD
jgi:hypothetical protein